MEAGSATVCKRMEAATTTAANENFLGAIEKQGYGYEMSAKNDYRRLVDDNGL